MLKVLSHIRQSLFSTSCFLPTVVLLLWLLANRLFFFKQLLSQGHLGARGGGYSHTLPIRVCASQRGRDFEAPDLERGIYFRGIF